MSVKPNFISKNLEIYSTLHGICNTFKPVINLLKTYLVRLFYIFLFQKNDNDN